MKTTKKTTTTLRATSACPWNTPDCGCDGTLYNPMGTAHTLSPTTKHTTRHTCGLAVPVVGHVAQCGSCNEIGRLDGKTWTWTRGGLDVDFARG